MTVADSQVSQLWTELASGLFGRIDDTFLATFRAPGGANNRLAAWDALDRTARYFKFLLFNAASAKPDRFFDCYRRVGNVGIGAPTFVTVRGCHINIDYFLAVDEFLFLEEALNLADVRSIVEIGAGFGRTCHVLMALADIERYTIIDIPEVLKLSSRYLERVLPAADCRKITFVDAQDSAGWAGTQSDLTINIDSFQEMPAGTIRFYMDRLIGCSKFLYCKNPIAKYHPSSIGLETSSAKTLDVLSLGLCRSVIDIFDDRELQATRTEYLKNYLPGPGWAVRAERPLDIFPYLHHALFENGNR